MPSPIARTLTYEDGEGRRKTVHQDEIADFRTPVVILGDPGMGKTVLTKALGDTPGMEYVKAGTFIRAAKPETLIAEGGRIVIDGLDQIASAAPSSAVEAVLEKLSAMGNPLFILSCREADWLGAADRIKIKDDYGVAPELLHLQPFSHDDARTFLSHEFPAVDADGLLNHLSDRGIEELYSNPLTLRMFGEIAQADNNLPESRAELFDRACRVMVTEENPYHEQDPHALTHEEELLSATGAVCAAQVLCDRIGIYTGRPSRTPDGFLNIADIKRLPLGEIAEDALRTRLFQSEGENRFTHIHRVIAEYLGAKWLAECFDNSVSARRIFSLFRQGEGVPTSLRGLHAWMAHFSGALADRCIAADPYAVLRYGNAETLSLDRARALLAALEQLSDQDPYFRSEDWGHHPASGLMRVELRNEILAVIKTPDRHRQLGFLLLEAMAGTELARELVSVLGTIMFDRNRSYHERACAWEALRAANVRDDWETVIRCLLDLKDSDSARLAFNILVHFGASRFSLETIIDTVLAHLGFAASDDVERLSNEIRHFSDRLFGDLDPGRLATLLDGLVQRARLLMKEVSYSTQSDFSDLVRDLTVRILETDLMIEPARLWTWIRWLDGHRGYKQDTKKKLAELLGHESDLRANLLGYVLLTPCAENTLMAGYKLLDTESELFPSAEEFARILGGLRGRGGEDHIDPETWRHLLLLGRIGGGLSAVLHTAAIETARGDSELLTILAEVSDNSEPAWRTEQRQHEATRKAKRQQKFASHRDALKVRQADITAGKFQVLSTPAQVYLGRHVEFDSDMTPVDRVYEFLGVELGDQVMSGFIAVLDREDLPTADDIAQTHSENEYWKVEAPMVEAPMVCGVAEILRRGQSVESINRNILAAVYMAWRESPDSGTVGGIDIGSALEKALFECEADWEAHFRLSVEPQLTRNRRHVRELYQLANDSRLANLAGRLAVEWLYRFPALPYDTQEELLKCALDNAQPETVRKLVVDRKEHVHQDYETILLWLSVDYAVDFDECKDNLLAAAEDDPEFLWLIRDRVAPRQSERFAQFSVDQLAYIVEAFGEHWPRIERPMGIVTSGVCNPWDASEFIRDAFNAIAGRPTPEATEGLQKLISNHAPTYANSLKHALALQRRARRDFEYVSPSVRELQAVMERGLPENIDDMRAYFADRIERLQQRIQGSNTDMWEAYWAGTQPKGENYCRNRMIEHISGQLPDSIRFEPEFHMPQQNRADIAAICNQIGLPIEIKGQWHSDVWNAASDQLDAKYTCDWHAEGRGVYIVLWFGNAPGKQLRRHPDGLARPETPQALEQMLIDRLPESRRAWIDVYVIDVSKP